MVDLQKDTLYAHISSGNSGNVTKLSDKIGLWLWGPFSTKLWAISWITITIETLNSLEVYHLWMLKNLTSIVAIIYSRGCQSAEWQRQPFYVTGKIPKIAFCVNHPSLFLKSMAFEKEPFWSRVVYSKNPYLHFLRMRGKRELTPCLLKSFAAGKSFNQS